MINRKTYIDRPEIDTKEIAKGKNFEKFMQEYKVTGKPFYLARNFLIHSAAVVLTAGSIVLFGLANINTANSISDKTESNNTFENKEAVTADAETHAVNEENENIIFLENRNNILPAKTQDTKNTFTSPLQKAIPGITYTDGAITHFKKSISSNVIAIPPDSYRDLREKQSLAMEERALMLQPENTIENISIDPHSPRSSKQEISLVLENNNSDLTHSDNDINGQTTNNEEQLSSTITEDEIVNVYENEQKAEMRTSLEKEDLAPTQSRESDFFLGLTYSHEVYSSLSDGGSEGYTLYFEQQTDSIQAWWRWRQANSFIVGPSFMYKFSKHFDLETGINYYRRSGWSIEGNDKDHDIWWKDGESKADYYSSIQVPIKLNYWLGKKNLQVGLTVGETMNFRIHAPDRSIWGKNYGQMLIGIGIGYTKNKFSFKIEPLVRFDRTDVHESNRIENFFSFSTNFGLYYKISK